METTVGDQQKKINKMLNKALHWDIIGFVTLLSGITKPLPEGQSLVDVEVEIFQDSD